MTERTLELPPEMRAAYERDGAVPEPETKARLRRACDVLLRVWHALDGKGLDTYAEYATPAAMWKDIQKRAAAVLAENRKIAHAHADRLAAASGTAFMLTRRQTAQMLGISPLTLAQRIRAGFNHPPYIVVGEGTSARYSFARDEVLRWIKSRTIKAKPGSPRIGRPPNPETKRKRKGK
ncbi:MAG: helix-turn-helix transcriptional regulator [Alphaproteobacteria bacterium]